MSEFQELEKQLSNYFEDVSSSAVDSAQRDEKILIDAVHAYKVNLENQTSRSVHGLWSAIMKSRTIKFAAVGIVILVGIILLTVSDKSVSPVYAVEQTLEAMRDIKTVYMAGEFYKQGDFECWMKFEGDPDKPTHMWLGREGHYMCKVCTPEGVFGLNTKTNVVHFAIRDERNKTWFIKFASFFEETVRAAQKNNCILISEKTDSETNRRLFVICINMPKREQVFYVDPETKLPIRFSTVRDDDPIEMMKKVLAVKNLDTIRYNEQVPENIPLAVPEGAKIVEMEIDCMVDPDSGLSAENLTEKEACVKLVELTGEALVELDIAELQSLALTFRIYPEFVWEKIKEAEQQGNWVTGLEITDEPYKEGDFWYVPAVINMADGNSEVSTAMVKFYDFENDRRCFIVGSKEKGLAD